MIRCVIVSSTGEKIGSFRPEGKKNLLDEAADANIELPFSCHAGACMSCAARILEGAELFDQEKDGVKYIDTDGDVVLTCIGGVKDEFVTDTTEHLLKIEMLID